MPREVLLGIWAMESGFGKIQGDMDVVRSMATLAAEGRRRDFAETQIKAALQIIATGEATRATLRGDLAAAVRKQTEHELKEQTWLRATEDFAEGVKSVNERRPGNFVGR